MAQLSKELLEKRLAALALADQVRIKRAADKKGIRSGRLDAAEILRKPPDHWRSEHLVNLLLCIPSVGRQRARYWCQLERVPMDSRIKTLSPRQRLTLAKLVDMWEDRRRDLVDRRGG